MRLLPPLPLLLLLALGLLLLLPAGGAWQQDPERRPGEAAAAPHAPPAGAEAAAPAPPGDALPASGGEGAAAEAAAAPKEEQHGPPPTTEGAAEGAAEEGAPPAGAPSAGGDVPSSGVGVAPLAAETELASLAEADLASCLASRAARIVDGVLAMSGASSLVVPHARLPRPPPALGPSSFTASLLVHPLEPPTGAFRGILWKGEGNSHRTPSLFLKPDSMELTMRVHTSRRADAWAAAPTGATFFFFVRRRTLLLP